MKTLTKKLVKKLRLQLADFLMLPPHYIGDNGCIRAAASFITWNQIEGDYLEFGVWQGYSFITAYHEISKQRKMHYKFGYDSPEYNQWKKYQPRFIAFDSFSGLPEGSEQARMVDYHVGAYACSENSFTNNLKAQSVNLEDVILVKGFYDKTCNDTTKHKHEITKAAIIMIDCDLYESTVPALNFITDIVQQGTIIIFDDWFRYKGNPNQGEQRACREWLIKNPQFELTEFWRQGPQAVAFLVNIKSGSQQN